MKAKTCKVCKITFHTTKQLQYVCSLGCAIAYAEQLRLKKEAKEATRKRKERSKALEDAKPRAQWMKEAQHAFNAYIRARDADHPCISCQRHHQGQYHAGHYRTTKAAPELRFNELNVHKQCSVCNNHMSGNILEYRINLIKKIGIENVEWIETKHPAQHFSIEELKRLKSEYKAKLRELNDKT